MKHLLVPLLDLLKGEGAGYRLGGVFFVLSLLWVIFGVLDMLFIAAMTLLGYLIGILYFTDRERLKELVDQIFPSGRFR